MQWINRFHWFMSRKFSHPVVRALVAQIISYNERGFGCELRGIGVFPVILTVIDDNGEHQESAPMVFKTKEEQQAFSAGMQYAIQQAGLETGSNMTNSDEELTKDWVVTHKSSKASN